MPPKHRLDDEESQTAEETPQKRKRHGKSARHVVEDMEETMKTINDRLPRKYDIGPGVYKIPRTLLNPGTSAGTVVAQLEKFKSFCQLKYVAVTAKIKSFPAETDADEGLLRATFIDGEVILAEIMSMADELQSTLFSKPPPSAYAEASIWRDVQTYPRPILCLRPTEKHGLPLVLFHRVFSQFQRLSRQPLPNSLEGVNALRVALALCSRMGEGFDDEKARGMAFDEAMGNFLLGVEGTRRLEGNQVSGEADRVYRVGGRCMIIREDKVEMGKAGDAYTQVARSYDLACERMETNGVTPNAPVFLLCMMGPSLTIAGGFKDGDDTVVEPLCPILFMLKDLDTVNGRAMQLATHLLALRTCLGQLPLLPNPPSPFPGMPRVFSEPGLTFQRRLGNDTLMFRAVDKASRQVCVKIVYRRYGEEVHQMLSLNKMAPDLLSVSRIDDGPTMIAMEMLDDSWQTLHTFAKGNPRWSNNRVRSTISTRLDDIVTKLEEEGFVHGDFRANNIMVKPGKEELAVVIDFDWAGKGGEVHYPLDRNHDGIQWPGEAASAIDLGHDRAMLATQWALLQE